MGLGLPPSQRCLPGLGVGSARRRGRCEDERVSGGFGKRGLEPRAASTLSRSSLSSFCSRTLSAPSCSHASTERAYGASSEPHPHPRPPHPTEAGVSWGQTVASEEWSSQDYFPHRTASMQCPLREYHTCPTMHSMCKCLPASGRAIWCAPPPPSAQTRQRPSAPRSAPLAAARWPRRPHVAAQPHDSRQLRR